MLKRFVLSGLLLIGAAGANAGVVVSFDQKVPTATGFDWSYKVTLEAGAQMAPLDFFVLYDVAGLTGTNWAPDPAANSGVPPLADWDVSEQLSGPYPGLTKAPDSGSLLNVVIKLEGTNIITPGANDQQAGKFLGELTVSTPIGQEGEINFASIASQTSGSAVFATSPLAGPVPEPSTVGIMGLGLAAVAVLARRRRRNR